MNGQEYKTLLSAGFGMLRLHCEEVNDLNVFPIPDGDTGDNMCSTMLGGVNAIGSCDEDDLSAVSDKAAHGMLLNARGNSGVILSQIFAGINKSFTGLKEAGFDEVTAALETGVKTSYGAVEKPTEGTILTVFREAVEYLKANFRGGDRAAYLQTFLTGAEASLERTPDLLPVLKEAGVIDSGGMGVCYIAKGMLASVRGEKIEEADFKGVPAPAADIDFSLFTENSVMKFGYCTEFLLRLTYAKTDVDGFDVDDFIGKLRTLGDSIVAFKTGTVVKVHVHTFRPDEVLAFALGYGEFLTMKIENMTLQHNETLVEKADYKKNKKRKKYGVVTVLNGRGLEDTFCELGADVVINGGQGKNPSLEEFLKAYDAVNADEIFVLPNNANIILVANASVAEYTASKIRVVPTRSVGDGYAALSTFDSLADSGDEIEEAMIGGMAQAVTGLVSRATRDANINGVDIKTDDFVGFSGKEMLVDDPERMTAAFELLDKLSVGDKYLLIAFYGKDVDENEREAFAGKVAEKYPSVEFYASDGGQDVYDYIFVLE